MGWVEKGADWLRRADERMSPVPDPVLQGIKRFPNPRDWQVLKWSGVVGLGGGVGIVGGVGGAKMTAAVGMYDNDVLGMSVAIGVAIGLFGGIAIANKVISEA